MAGKHDRAAQLRELLRTTLDSIDETPAEKQSPLINTANRLSRELWELETGQTSVSGAELPDTDGEEEDTGVTIFLERMRQRDRTA